MKIYVFLIIIFLIIIIYYSTELNFNRTPDIDEDGFLVFNSKPTREQVISKLPNNYVFLDYEYYIEGCSLTTFHRDVTSSQYIYKTKYPIYTFITYEHEGQTLSLCPGSHKTTPFLYSRPVTLQSKAVLFNCDIVHAGSFNDDFKTRKTTQYKIAHIDDLDKLSHLQGIRKKKISYCNDKNYRVISYIYRILTLIFSFIINHITTPFLQSRKSNFLCKLIGEDRCYYNK